MKNNIGKKITIVLFLLFIFGFFGLSILKPDKKYSELENRSLAERPAFTPESFFAGEFTEDYESYIQDQFPLRDGFVSMKNYTELALGKNELKGILIGKDDYLIENHDREDYESERAQRNAKAIISAGNRWAEKLGAEHTSIMIVPTAQSVLQSKLPTFAKPYNQMEYIGPIKEGLVQDVFIDVYDMLKSHSEEYIYYKTDHHWTTYGAYLAYRQWCEEKGLQGYTMDGLSVTKASDEFLGTTHSKLNIKTAADVIEIYSVKDYNVKAVYNMGAEVKDTLFDESFLEGKDKYSVFFGGNQGMVEITEGGRETVSDKRLTDNVNGDGSESVLMIIKDSYANCFAPMTAGMYDRIYVIDLRYFNMQPDAFMEMYGVTDVLLLYNADTLTDDVYVSRIR